MLHGREAALALFVELVNSLRDARFADAAVKSKSLGERPAVLERVEAARRHLRGRRYLRSSPPHPVEARDARRRDRPPRLGRKQDARTARSEQPFVATGREHVATEGGHGLVLD